MNTWEWLQFILSYAVQATAVLVISWCVELSIASSTAKSRAWTSCFVSLLLLFSAGMLLPKLQIYHPWSTLAASQRLRMIETQRGAALALLTIWGLGIAFVVLARLWKFRQLQTFIRSTRSLSRRQRFHVDRLLEPGRTKAGGRAVQFRISPEILGPFCYQFHPPLVFLPESLLSGDMTRLRHVLWHELTHLRTSHPVQLFLQRLVQTILWFHPLVWVCGRRANLVREFVCDDASASATGTVINYVRTLLSAVNRRQVQSGTFAMGRTASELKQRVMRLASGPEGRQPNWARYAASIPLLSAVVISQLWLPTNPLSAQQSDWSRWPRWTAKALQAFDIYVRDYDCFDEGIQVHELIEDMAEQQASISGR